MNAKIFSNIIFVKEIQDFKPHWDDRRGRISLTSYEIDKFKKEMEQLYRAGKLSYGKYRNIMTATNVFADYVLNKKIITGEVKSKIITERVVKNNKIVEVSIETKMFELTEKDLLEFFNTIYTKVSLHTFQVYLKYIQLLLEKILEKRGEYLEDYFRLSLFKADRYRLSVHDYKHNTKSYSEFDSQKFVKLADIKDALEYLSKVKESIDNEQIEMSQLTYDKLKIATLLLVFTGARGTEIANLRCLDINFKDNYLIFYRNKIKINERATVFPLHPYLKKELRRFIRNYQLSTNDFLLGNWRYLDKFIKHYYTPKRILKVNDKYITLNKRKYRVDKSIITVRKFRKFWDNYAEGKMDSKYKNYLLGRYVGVDMVNYVSVIHNKKVFKKLKDEYMKVFGNLDKKLKKQLDKI